MEGDGGSGKKLALGVRLLKLHPEVAYRDCEDCKQWVYNEETGQRDEKGGKPVPRYSGIKPPCGYSSQGCAKGTPENSVGLTEQNTMAYQFIRECRAVGRFPDDAIVRHNAALIEEVEQDIRDRRQQELNEWIKALVQAAIR